MMFRQKSSYLGEKLFQNSEKPEEFCKTLNSVGLSSTEGRTSKISLNKDGIILFESRQGANIFKMSYPELATDLSKKREVR